MCWDPPKEDAITSFLQFSDCLVDLGYAVLTRLLFWLVYDLYRGLVASKDCNLPSHLERSDRCVHGYLLRGRLTTPE
jgi:hypothetical protein